MTQSSQLGVVSVQQGPDGCEQGPAPPRTERAKSWPIDDLFGVFKSFETFKKKKNLGFSLKDLEKSPPGD